MRAATITLLLWLFASPAWAQHWRDADLGGDIAEGAASREFLWLRGSNDVLVRFDRTTGERVVLGRDVIDVLADDDRLWAMSGSREGFEVSIRDLREEEFRTVSRHGDDRPIALLGRDGEVPDVLRAESYVAEVGGRRVRRSIAARLAPYAHVARDATGAIYVGYNRGEWGGGLRRIDPQSGAVAFVSNGGEAPCSGELNPACEPVVGLFQDRRAPECVIVGTGLAHMGSSHGDVYRVCGSAISSVFSTPVPAAPDRWIWPGQSWPLFSLVETEDGWIGISRDRYFRARGDSVEERPIPAFQDWSGLRISPEDEGVLFVVSACCWGNVENPTLYSTLAIPVGP